MMVLLFRNPLKIDCWGLRKIDEKHCQIMFRLIIGSIFSDMIQLRSYRLIPVNYADYFIEYIKPTSPILARYLMQNSDIKIRAAHLADETNQECYCKVCTLEKTVTNLSEELASLNHLVSSLQSKQNKLFPEEFW
jgi:hypothetical protein